MTLESRRRRLHKAAKMIREDELLRLLMAGFMLKEAATHLDLAYWTVRKYASAPEFMVKLRELSTNVFERVDAELKHSKESIMEKLEKASDKALAKMESLLDLPTAGPMLQFKAAQDLLDRRAEVSRTKRVDATVDQKHSFVNPLLLVHAANTAREMDEYAKRHPDNGGERGSGRAPQLPPSESDE